MAPIKASGPGMQEREGRIHTSGTVWDLKQPLGGLFDGRTRARPGSDEPRLITHLVRVGDLAQLFRRQSAFHSGRERLVNVTGVGLGLTDEEAELPAVCEALERYCCVAFVADDFTIASAEELGSEALDLDRIPRCSDKELAHPKCPLIAPNKSLPIRWVTGLSLHSGKKTYIPAVMVGTHIRFASPGERIVFPISTGCAAHTTLERALLGGIFEAAERDAIAVLWLQKLPLPQIIVDFEPEGVAPYLQSLRRATKDMESYFFDATTDVGIPTVYGVQRAHWNRTAATFVSCASAASAAEALAKVIRDMSHCRSVFRRPRPTPDNIEDFTDIFHGATYMAREEQAHGFDFLLKSGSRRRLSEIPALEADSEKSLLALTLNRLREKGFDTFAVELSADEALRSGIRVVKAIIPGLQPLSFNYRARYLGHPRLYEAPTQMGYKSHAEEDLNHLPQPFA
jgi:ribosomal protein S12 methylthiotransferase accessory factor